MMMKGGNNDVFEGMSIANSNNYQFGNAKEVDAESVMMMHGGGGSGLDPFDQQSVAASEV